MLVAAKKESGPNIRDICNTCMVDFSASSLRFTKNRAKCERAMTQCAGGKSNKCEPVISQCIEDYCQAENACSDAATNRRTLVGCLKTEGAYLPFQCADMVSARAGDKARQVQTFMAEKRRTYELQSQQNQAKIAAEQAAAAKADADAKARMEQERIAAEERKAEADRRAAAELEAQRFQQQQAAEAATAERARQAEKQAKEEAKQALVETKPNVYYNQLMSRVKSDLGKLKTQTQKVFSTLGVSQIKSADYDPEKYRGSIMSFPPAVVEVDPMDIEWNGADDGTDNKLKFLKQGTKYADRTYFRCAKDAGESTIRSELLSVNSGLGNMRSSLMEGITKLESMAADDGAPDVDEGRINKLYEVYNLLGSSMAKMEDNMGALKTGCPTRCNGMGNMMMQSSSAKLIPEIKYDSKGNIIKQEAVAPKSGAAGDYNCPELTNSATATDPMMAMMGGGAFDMNAVLGGVGQQVMDLTKRVLKAAVDADKIVEETSVYLSVNNTLATKDGSSINACTNVLITDAAQYVACSTQILNKQLMAYQKEKSPNTSAKEKLNESVVAILRQINTPTYTSRTPCSRKAMLLCCDDNEKTKIQPSSGTQIIDTPEDGIECITNLTTRLNNLLSPAGSFITGNGNNSNANPWEDPNNARIRTCRNNSNGTITITFTDGTPLSPSELANIPQFNASNFICTLNNNNAMDPTQSAIVCNDNKEITVADFNQGTRCR